MCLPIGLPALSTGEGRLPGKKEKPMRVKNKTLAGIAVLALAGSAMLAGTAAPAGNAATVACGPACKAPFARQWGANLIGAVLAGIPRAGQNAVLYPAAPRNAEDWQFLYQGTVAAFYEAGIIGAAVGKTWPSYPARRLPCSPAGPPRRRCGSRCSPTAAADTCH